MNPLAQNIAVLAMLGLAVAYVGWQILQGFRGRKSKLGSCCSKGCDAALADSRPKNQAASPVQFMPVEMLGRRHVK